jgi:hypothetical protein
MPEREVRLSWQATTEQETETSVKARADYERQIAVRKKGEIYPPPPPITTEVVTARGSVEGVDLQQSNVLALPAYWLPGPTHLLQQRSAIWLSQNAYREFEQASSTDVYFDVTSQTAGELLTSSKTWVEAVKRLRAQEITVSHSREPARLHVQGGLLDWPLTINGRERFVRVWKAKNDFGELVILANRQNPLILKATVNPVFPGLSQVASGEVDWDRLFGYEIKRVRVEQAK